MKTAETEARAQFDPDEVRERLKQIRDSGFERLTGELRRRSKVEKEWPLTTPEGDPFPPPRLSDIECVAVACLLLFERNDAESSGSLDEEDGGGTD